MWLIVGGIAAAAVLLIALLVIQWRRRRASVKGVLKSIAAERLEQVVVPNGMGGVIQIEHLVLTAHGILVVDFKPIEGVVFASDRMNEWTAMSKHGRFTFPNPQSTLYDRVAAIRQLVRDAEVTGLVLFPDSADFSKGRPRDVILLRELGERYKKPERSAADKPWLAFAQHWQRLREVAAPAELAGKRP